MVTGYVEAELYIPQQYEYLTRRPTSPLARAIAVFVELDQATPKEADLVTIVGLAVQAQALFFAAALTTPGKLVLDRFFDNFILDVAGSDCIR